MAIRRFGGRASKTSKRPSIGRFKLSSKIISKSERAFDREIDLLSNSAAQGTRKAASRSRSVSNIHVFVKDGKLIQQQDEAIIVLKQLKTEKMRVGTRFNLRNVRSNARQKKQKVESFCWS